MNKPYFLKAMFAATLFFACFFSKAQASSSATDTSADEPSQISYLVKVESAADKSWGYVISQNGKTIFRSSESTSQSKQFVTELEAMADARIKIKHLRENN